MKKKIVIFGVEDMVETHLEFLNIKCAKLFFLLTIILNI